MFKGRQRLATWSRIAYRKERSNRTVSWQFFSHLKKNIWRKKRQHFVIMRPSAYNWSLFLSFRDLATLAWPKTNKIFLPGVLQVHFPHAAALWQLQGHPSLHPHKPDVRNRPFRSGIGRLLVTLCWREASSRLSCPSVRYKGWLAERIPLLEAFVKR